MNTKIQNGAVSLCCLFLLSVTGLYPLSLSAGAFDKGNTTATLALGSGQFFRDDYLIIGAGVGHFLADGIEVGLDIDYWTGGDPDIYELTPKLTYIYDNTSQFKPYLGLFYNRTYIDGFEDSDALGYRAGVYMPAGSRTFFGVGIVHTELQDCSESVFVSCSETYTQFSVIFSL